MRRPILFLVMLLAGLMAGCISTEAPVEFIEVRSNSELKDKTLFVENEYLSLDFDCATTQIIVTDKASGKQWLSNPAEAAQDSIAVKSGLEKLQSQVLVTYGQINGVMTEINSYSLSVVNNTYDWEALADGVKVRYTLGKVEREFIVPAVLTESHFMEYYEQMETDQQKALNNYYRILDIEKLKATDDKEALLETYPTLAEERMFLLRENLQKNIMERLEGYFEGIGYTVEDYLEDKEAANAGEESATPVFNVSVIYRLDGPDLVVTVPLDEIEYRSTYPILSVAVLPFFGAGGLEDEGYMLVPDASGALIHFNNGKQNQLTYNNALYGYDYAQKRTAIVSDNAAYFPVFGIQNNGASFLCVVEDGAEDTVFEADVSGRLNTYNYANTRYTVLKWDDVDISKANVYAKAFERKELTGVFQQRYIFLDSPDYADMAVAYRDYLTSRYPSLTRSTESGLPFALNLLGAIDRTTNIAGLPVVVAYPLTTYQQASNIINNLSDAGVSNLRVNLTGWFNGGVTHDTPANIHLISELGGRKAFESLLDTADQRGVDLFVEADFTFINNIGAFNGFWVNRDSAKRLSRELVKIYPYSFVWFGERTGGYGEQRKYYLANPAYTLQTIDRFYDRLQKLGGSNITFSSIGRSVNSDFNVKNPASRQAVIAMQQQKMEELQSKEAKLMIHGGNVYAVPYSDFILDFELETKNFNIIDEGVPFYQMVLHGLVPYASSPLNLSNNYQQAVLKAVETGAGLHYLFMNAAGEALQDTSYTRYYASDINRWGNRPVELYQRVNDLLAHTVNQYIVDHQKLSAQAFLTEYEDGTQVIVNYASEPFEYEGQMVNGLDFAVIRK